MTTRSGPIALVLAGVAQAGATGIDWQGGFGTLFVSNATAADFECTVDGGVTWIDVMNSGSGAALTGLTTGAFPFALAPCRIRMSVGGGAGNVYASRID